MSHPVVKIGTRFRTQIADGNPEFECEAEIRTGVWRCVGTSDPFTFDDGTTVMSDSHGTIIIQPVEEIRRAVRIANSYDQQVKKSEDFWSTIKLGQILHYHNGFGEYVRCEVIVGRPGDNSISGGDYEGLLCMQPIALIGNWERDKPVRRTLWGDVQYNYHAKKIIENTGAWRANESCIFEYAGFKQPQHPKAPADPRTCKPLSLTPPSLTATETQSAADCKTRNEVASRLRDGFTPEILQEAATMLADYLLTR